jgi:hypothetical protein
MSFQRGLASDRIGVDCSGWRRMLSLLLSQSLCGLNDIARPDSGAGLGELHKLGSFAQAGINLQSRPAMF